MGRNASFIELTKADRDYRELQTRACTIQAQSVMLCLKKYKEGGIEKALFDAPGCGRNAEITDEEKAWIINLACLKPADFGYVTETWTYAKLTSHINKTAEAAGITRLSTIWQFCSPCDGYGIMDIRCLVLHFFCTLPQICGTFF